MNAHEEEGLLSALVDGALVGEERARVEAHVAGCALCREELAGLRRVKERLASSPRRAMPPELLAQLESGWDRPRPRIWAGALSHEQARRWAPAAALVAVLAFGAWLGFFRHNSEAELPIDVLAAAHSRYTAEGLVPGDMVASNFSRELAATASTNDN